MPELPPIIARLEPVTFPWDREAGWIFFALERALRGGDRVRALLAPMR